jgi:hypothetical protein
MTAESKSHCTIASLELPAKLSVENAVPRYLGHAK